MVPTIELRTGARMPLVGWGTWKVPHAACPDLLAEAVKLGYRHFDCACDYGNEAEVGRGLRAVLDSGACRRDNTFCPIFE